MFSRKDLIRLMIPLLAEQILNVLVGMIDVIMVGVIGEAAVSGVSLLTGHFALVRLGGDFGEEDERRCIQYRVP